MLDTPIKHVHTIPVATKHDREPEMSYTQQGYGDRATWNAHAKRNDPQADDGSDEWLDDESAELAELTLQSAELSALIADHEEWALLDNLLDAYRYNGDRDGAWADLRRGLKDSLAARIRADLKHSRGL